MPRKKKPHEPEEMTPDLRFTDRTINEAVGNYSEVVEIMHDDGARRPWCLKTYLTMLHPFGVCEFSVEFWDDGRVTILEYMPSNKDLLLNADLRFLSIWCYQRGWRKPQPSQFVVKDAMEFWKHMWTTHQVDSDFLELRYGQRDGMGIPVEDEESSSEESDQSG